MTNRRQHAMHFVQILLVLVALTGAARAQEMLDDSRLVRGPRVRSAFRDVVSNARHWTVRVLVDGTPSAMGVIVRDDGWILTKSSRLDGTVTCRLLDGRLLDAQQQHAWPQHDLALIKVDAQDLRPVVWADGDDPAVGQWLATVDQASSPLGVGIVSVDRRSIPLVRLSGVLGVKLERDEGPATVVEVIQDSAAEKARLQSGDVVVRINDRNVPDGQSMIELIREHEPGQTVHLWILRGDKELTFEVTLSHPFGIFLSRIAEQNQMGGELSRRRTGFPAVIQHDTVLAPDECGGTVVDLDGRAVGVNIARAGRTESYAIPAAVILPLLNAYFSDVESRSPETRFPPPPPSFVRTTR